MIEELKEKIEDKIWYWLCYARGIKVKDCYGYAKETTEDIIKLLERPEKVEDSSDTYILSGDEEIINWEPSNCQTDSVGINSVDDPDF